LVRQLPGWDRVGCPGPLRRGRTAVHGAALLIWEKALGPEDPSSATPLNNLARLYENQGRYAGAEPMQRRSVGIYERALGPEHPFVGTIAEQPGLAVSRPGTLRRADTAVSARPRPLPRRRWVPSTPTSATSLNKPGQACNQDQGRYADAEPLVPAQPGHLGERRWVPSTPRRRAGVNNLALLYESQGRYPRRVAVQALARTARKGAGS